MRTAPASARNEATPRRGIARSIVAAAVAAYGVTADRRPGFPLRYALGVAQLNGASLIVVPVGRAAGLLSVEVSVALQYATHREDVAVIAVQRADDTLDEDERRHYEQLGFPGSARRDRGRQPAEVGEVIDAVQTSYDAYACLTV
jgi:hypothetical protein